MNADQIIDTAEFILDNFHGLSIRALQHCFNMIKMAEPPFNKELYNTINGTKIMKFIQDYDKYVDNKLFSKANLKVERAKFIAKETFEEQKTLRRVGDLSTEMQNLKEQTKKIFKNK